MEVEILNYYACHNLSTKKGSFTLVWKGVKYLDCTYWVKGDNRWFSFPQKKIERGGDVDWMPYVCIVDKEEKARLQDKVLEILKDMQPQGSYGKKKDDSVGPASNQVQAESPSLW